MSSNLYTLSLEPYDDVASIQDRLLTVRARRVLLLWPPGASILRRKLDLLRVQRQAARLGMQIALVTSDWTVIEHAGDLDISVFPDEQAAAQSRWKSARTHVFDAPGSPARAGTLAETRAALASAAGPRPALRWSIFVGLLAAIVVGFLIAAPSATVVITPASRQVHETVTVIADPALTDIDIENHRMPAAVAQLEATARVTIQSTGLESAGASQAQGLVVFGNLSAQPIVIALGTVVATSDTYPVRFETLVETTLPAGDSVGVQIPVRALPEYSGPAGNVDPGAINRLENEFSGVVSVTNPNATYGGTIQERRLVTADDHERLRVLGRQQVLQNARDILLHQLAGDQFLVDGSLVILEERPQWTNFSAFVGDAAESVSLDLRARVQAVVVDERLAQQVAYTALAPYVKPGQEIAPGALAFARGEILQIEPQGRVTFLMSVSGSIAESINADAVRGRLVGISVDEARRRLENELLLDPARPVRITTWPGGYGRMPFIPVRISVRVNTP